MRVAGVLADLMVAAHFLFLGFLLVGGFLALRNLRWLWLHLAVAGWAFLSVITKWPCPLTGFEKWLREQAGQTPYDGPFINHYVDGVFYPVSAKQLVMLFTGLLVLASWALVAYHYWAGPALHRARARTASISPQAGAASRGSSGHSSTSPDAHSAHSATRR